MVFGDGTFMSFDGTLRSKVTVLIISAGQLAWSLSTMWGHRLWTSTTCLLEPGHAGILISGFHTSGLREVNFCCLEVTQFMALC
jgi:hypothetical protein